MDEHLVKCEAMGEEDSWGYDASSSSLDITDGIDEVDDSGGGSAPVSTSRSPPTGALQTYRRTLSFLGTVLDELVMGTAVSPLETTPQHDSTLDAKP